MKRHTFDPHATEPSGSNIADRSIELANQRWNQGKSTALAASEGIGVKKHAGNAAPFIIKSS